MTPARSRALRRASTRIGSGIAVIAAVLWLAQAGVARAQTTGAFAGLPNFGAGGQAAAVFLGGTVDQLEAAARTSGANGVWVQDAGGRFQLLVVGGPAFLRDGFTAQFPGGFATSTAVTLTRPPGASSAPPPIVTSTPSPPVAAPSPSPGGVPGPSSND